MTNEELAAIIAGVTANLAPAATAVSAPTASAGWVGQAKAAKSNARAKAVKATPIPDGPATAYQPKPLSFEIQTVTYDPTKHKAPFDAFRVLVVTNGANGKFNRSVRLDKRFLSAILEVGSKALGQL